MLLRSLELSTLLIIFGQPVLAQVTADGTAGTVVLGNGPITIAGGSLQSTTLFHSFSDFSPGDNRVTFALDRSKSATTTVIGRVTGQNSSLINGPVALIGGSSPDLFLINPNGITFGANASLALPGSFVASTADSVLFKNENLEFSARNPNGVPLLTVSTPTGLHFSGAASSIQVRGNGNNSLVPRINSGLASFPGKTIAFVGGDVAFSGGIATSTGGRIEVGAVETGTVSLMPPAPSAAGWKLGYDQVQAFGDVALNDRSSLWNPDLTGNALGGIQVVGRDISLDQSQIAAATAGSQQGGSIAINAQRSLTLGGVHPNAIAPGSWIFNQVTLGASGNSGDIDVRAKQIKIQDGATIETFSLGSGRSGDIHVDTGSNGTLLIEDAVPVTPSLLLPLGSSESRISTTAYATGSGGNIDVTTGQLSLYNSGRITTLSNPGSTGNGGDINVTASQIFAEGLAPGSVTSPGISTVVSGSGDGGGITVNTDDLSLIDGGVVLAFAASFADIPGTGRGRTGDVKITANNSIEVSGTSPVDPTLISILGSTTTGEGNAGNVTVTTPTLSLRDGAVLGSSTLPIVGTFGDISLADRLGNSGEVRVNVRDQLSISGVNPFTLGGSILGNTSFGGGDLGTIDIQANRIVAQDGGSISSLIGASGNAGSIKVKASDILIEGVRGLPAAISANAPILSPTTRQFYGLPDAPSGNTGELAIAADRLTIRDGGTVSVQHAGTGNAGQLAIQANSVVLNAGSISAQTASGEGGNIGLSLRDFLLLRDNSAVVATAGGSGNGGNITINTPFTIGTGNSDIVANAVQGSGGNIDISTQGLYGLEFRDQLTPENDITASSEFGVNGTVAINNLTVNPGDSLAKLPESLNSQDDQVATACSATGSNQFVVSGRGGLPASPSQKLIGSRPWTDTRDLGSTMHNTDLREQAAVSESFDSNNLQASERSLSERPIPVEALGWSRNEVGEVELVANSATVNAAARPTITCLDMASL